MEGRGQSILFLFCIEAGMLKVAPSPFRKRLQSVTKALHKHGCLLLPLPEQLAREIIFWAQAIPDSDLGPGGRELEPHITIKYGFTDDSPEAIQVLRALLVRHGPITVQLKEVSLFENNEDGDVLKIDIDSQELHELHAAISELVPNVEKFPTYLPHITIAYLKPAVAKGYLAGTFPFLGRTIMFDRAQYSCADGTSVDISLSFLGGDGLRTAPPKAIPAYHSKSEGEPCEQGETAAQSGCVPASGDGHKKPSEQGETLKQHKPVHESEAFKKYSADDSPIQYGLTDDEDVFLADYCREIGFAEKPKVVSKQEMDDLVKEGHVELFRGLSDSGFSEQFKRGQLFGGRGVHGNGTYTAYGEEGIRIAKHYATGEGTVSRMTIDYSAKVGNLEDLEEEMLKEKKLYQRQAKKQGNLDFFIYRDVGRFAAHKGYDVVDVGYPQYMVILNRAKVIIQDEDLS